MNVIKTDHGYTKDSQVIRQLVNIMSDWDRKTQRDFLSFMTGSPRLPVGGKARYDTMTFIRKTHMI